MTDWKEVWGRKFRKKINELRLDPGDQWLYEKAVREFVARHPAPKYVSVHAFREFLRGKDALTLNALGYFYRHVVCSDEHADVVVKLISPTKVTPGRQITDEKMVDGKECGKSHRLKRPDDYVLKHTSELVRELKSRNLSARTIQNYTIAVKRYLTWLGRPPGAGDNDELKNYAIHLRESAGLDASTVNLYTTGVRFLYREVLGLAGVDEHFRRMKETKRIPPFYSREHVEKILNGAVNEKHCLVLLLAYGSGLRRNEIGELRVESIDYSRNILRITGKGSKMREVPIDPEVAMRLRSFTKGIVRGYVFEGATPREPYNRRTVAKIYENACSASGIVRKGGIHTLRHSYATHLRQQGVDLRVIQELLGHSSIKTTQMYLHVGNEEIDKVVSPVKGMKIGTKRPSTRSNPPSVQRE